MCVCVCVCVWYCNCQYNTTLQHLHRLFADDYTIYGKITNKYTEILQKDLDTLGEWVIENGMKINPGKSKAIRFMRARLKIPLGYSLGDQKTPEASTCKYFGIIL